MDVNILKSLGFSDKSADVYLALLKLGPSSVRKLAEFCNLNRGTTYDTLKWLQEQGVVNFYHKDTKQHFMAEDPGRLHELIKKHQEELERANWELNKALPELQALHARGGERPVARYFEGEDIREILEDILDVCEHVEDPTYRVYSTEGIRDYVYKDFPTFSDVRIAKGIAVKVIAIGEGGELRGLDERKWLSQRSKQDKQIKQDEKPTYIIMYPGKTAYISLDAKDELVGVVIENEGVYETQRTIFDELWSRL